MAGTPCVMSLFFSKNQSCSLLSTSSQITYYSRKHPISYPCGLSFNDLAHNTDKLDWSPLKHSPSTLVTSFSATERVFLFSCPCLWVWVKTNFFHGGFSGKCKPHSDTGSHAALLVLCLKCLLFTALSLSACFSHLPS